jgi:UDP-N-acetylglucosamine transferase subunit ALG13
MNKKKVIGVASIGGHWIQLQRIARPLEEYYEMVYVSTHPKCAAMVEGKNYYLVAHAGIGSILTSLRRSKPLIILPRLASLGEHRNDHQNATAQMIKENKYAYVATNEKELRELLHMDLRPLKKIGEFASESLVKSLKDFIDFNV